MKRKLIIVAEITAAVILAAGCIEYNQELTLYDDGSGVVKVHYLSDSPHGTGGAPILSFSEEDIINEYSGSNLTIRDIDISIPGDDEIGSHEATYYIDFIDVADLNGYGVTDVKNGIQQTLSFNEEDERCRIEQLINVIAEIEDPTMWTDYRFTYKIVCPGIITDTNGTIGYGGRTVTWEFTIPELEKRPVKIYAVYGESRGTGNGQGSIGPGKTSD
jgi:hypothetical protein